MNNFRDLIVWQKSIDFVVRIYDITKDFPKEEKFNLTSQMQRAATSIPSNISEGAGRNTNAWFKQFLSSSLGSAHELETQIIISNKLGYINEECLEKLLVDLTGLQKMLWSLSNTLKV